MAEAEWLCKSCDVIHLTQRPGKVLQPCPQCGAPMHPTSVSLRKIERLECQLQAAESANAALRDERDAWMAHAELGVALAKAVAVASDCDCCDGGRYDPAEEISVDMFKVAVAIQRETPPISLAKRDARMLRELAAQIRERLSVAGTSNEYNKGYAAALKDRAILIEARADEMEGKGA